MPAVLWLQMMPATSNSPRTSEDPFCERDDFFWNILKRHCDHCVCSHIAVPEPQTVLQLLETEATLRAGEDLGWSKKHTPGTPSTKRCRISNSKNNYIGHTGNLESLNRVEQLKWNDTSNSWHFVTLCGLHVNGACKWSRCKKHSTKSFATSLAWTLRIWRDMRRTHTFNLARPWIQEQKLLQDALNKQHNAAWKRLPPGGEKGETRELGICNTTASKLELQKNKQE